MKTILNLLLVVSIIAISACATQSTKKDANFTNNSSANRINAPGYMFK